jgi:spore coat protein H
MTMHRSILAVTLALALVAQATAANKGAAAKPAKIPTTPPKEKKNDPSNLLFATNAPIYTFKIDISGGELAALQKDDRSYARGTLTVGTNVLRDVAFRVKGNGSRRPLGEKPSLVAKFDHYAPGQKLFGLSKIAINNSSQDPTYLADFIANGMFTDANVPVARVTHARVTLNGRELGLYFIEEMHNKDFLKRWFKNGDGNLYEAYLADVDSQMDQDGGEGRGQKDLKRFADVVKIADPAERWARLPEVLDVDRYVSHLVCELFTSHTDGYAMNRNNYRVYHHPDTDRFTFLAHGVDWAFGNAGVSMNPPQNSLVTRAVLSSQEGNKLFKERRLTLLTNVFQLEVLTNRVNAAVGRLVAQARNTGETNDYLHYGQDMNNRLVSRWRFVTNELFGPPPIPLRFDQDGVARLSGWTKKTDQNSAPALHDRGTDGSHRVLHIATTTNASTVASWRTKVILPKGLYFLEGEARAAGIITKTNEIGLGAGLRLSGDKQRPNKLEGDAPWTRLQHSIANTNGVDEAKEVVIVCELRAIKGEVWFDEDSLRIVKQK